LVLAHPWVVGELALGGAAVEVLRLLQQLPQSNVATDREVLALIESQGLAGRGIGWVDAALLASVKLTPGSRLVTGDRKLHAAAEHLGIA
jgi:predicted nucleic acid-binding protein